MQEKIAEKIWQENLLLHQATANNYDVIHNYLHNKTEQKWLAQDIDYIVNDLFNKSLEAALDIGCGTGNITLKLLKQKVNLVVGVDISPKMIAVLNKKVKVAGIENNFIGITSKIENIDKTDSFSEWNLKIQALFISSVLHHLPDYLGTLNFLLSLFPNIKLIYITHEPKSINKLKENNQIKKIWNNIIRGLDVSLGKLNKKPETKEKDYKLADYHIFSGQGVDEEKIKHLLAAYGFNELIIYRTYNLRRTSFVSWLDNNIFSFLRNDIFPITMFTVCWCKKEWINNKN